MATLWPWIVISCGIVALFGYRFSGSWQRCVDIATKFFSLLSPGATNEPSTEEGIDESQSTKVRAKVRDAGLQALAPHHDWMPAVISLLVLLSALYIILSNDHFGEAQQKWAYATVGTILGYWLKR